MTELITVCSDAAEKEPEIVENLMTQEVEGRMEEEMPLKGK